MGNARSELADRLQFLGHIYLTFQGFPLGNVKEDNSLGIGTLIYYSKNIAQNRNQFAVLSLNNKLTVQHLSVVCLLKDISLEQGVLISGQSRFVIPKQLLRNRITVQNIECILIDDDDCRQNTLKDFLQEGLIFNDFRCT